MYKFRHFFNKQNVYKLTDVNRYCNLGGGEI